MTGGALERLLQQVADGFTPDGETLADARREFTSLQRVRRATAQVREEFPFTACGPIGVRASRLLDEVLT